MCALIIFVALWMNLQSGQSNSVATVSASINEIDSAGFRADAWYLPSDELLGFVKIPAGPFLMGSNPALDRSAYENERWSNRRRQGLVDLPEYYIGKYEVTVAQFKTFTENFPLQANPVAASARNNHPIANVTWPEALAYARWLEQQMKFSENTPEALREFLDTGARLLLPSEAEWEKAARGSDGRVFPWGNHARGELANYASNHAANYASNHAANSVLPVGAKPCGECTHGLADMSGNVWEFTRSPLQSYPFSAADDAENLSDDALWVMRGGSYADAVANVRAAVRGGVGPGVRSPTIGFRLVITKL